ncbi:MAG: hypothetical protein MNPFHGCM_00607 [Gemmatimonadaceae bacterium]|nr:hypothetical protein [Gemmatimonadaceae bacterium]
MKHFIDVSVVLRQTGSGQYSNLVTRSTGAAVRQEIELAVAALPERTLTIIDFSSVGMMDFSCADEVVGKLLNDIRRGPEPREVYIAVSGVGDSHLEAIETVLECYGLAVVVEDAHGPWRVVGPLDDDSRRACNAVNRRGRACAADIAPELGESADLTDRTLNTLWERRLVMRDANGYLALQMAL